MIVDVGVLRDFLRGLDFFKYEVDYLSLVRTLNMVSFLLGKRIGLCMVIRVHAHPLDKVK